MLNSFKSNDILNLYAMIYYLYQLILIPNCQNLYQILLTKFCFYNVSLKKNSFSDEFTHKNSSIFNILAIEFLCPIKD